jgi:hypothetical protein
MYKGHSDWSHIARKTNQEITMPIFEWRHRLASQYKMNTDGIMIGRAAIGYPGF